MSAPLISVIIPVYNSAKYLLTTLQSVQRQTLKDFEVICIDDGSTDDSPQILEHFSHSDSRFIFRRQKNAGGSAARNTGLDVAAGKFIAFLDNDDIYHPQYLEVLYRNLIAADADISCCSYLRFEGDSDYEFSGSLPEIPHIDFISEHPFTDKFVKKKKIDMLMWTKLYRRELFTDIRFALDLPAINDMLLNLEILLKSKRATVCRVPLIAYRQIASSQTLKPLSFARIEEYKNLCIDINKLAASYPKQRTVLQKLATRYAYDMHVAEYSERYNPQQDTEHYEVLRRNLAELIQNGYLKPSTLGLRRRLKLWAFRNRRFALLKWLKK